MKSPLPPGLPGSTRATGASPGALTRDTVVQRRPELLARATDGDVVLGDFQAGTGFSMQATARRLWQLVETPIAISEVCERLAREYDARASDVEPDVLEFLEELRREGLLRIVETRPASPSPRAAGRGRTHLLLALGRAAMGESAIGMRIARDLLDVGETTTVVSSRHAAPLFQGGPLPSEVADGRGPGLSARIEELVQELKPASILLADHIVTCDALRLVSVDPGSLLSFGIPVLAIDVWGADLPGLEHDRRLGDRWKKLGYEPFLERTIQPVPTLPPSGRIGQCALLQPPVQLSSPERRSARETLGIGHDQKAILFHSTVYHHEKGDNPDVNRLADAVPVLLMQYLAELGPRVHLLHVGPQRLPAAEKLQDRYHFLGLMPPDRHRVTLGCADMVLSLSMTGSTTAVAVTSSIPTLVVRNSCEAATGEEVAAWLSRPLSWQLRDWLKLALPLHPFVLWPLRLDDVMRAHLEGNAYCETFRTVELLDESAFLEGVRNLLWDAAVIDAYRHRQAAYVERVRRLPRPAEAVHAFLK